jgi:transcriptional regulator with XRE-family HTH domain
MKKIDKPIYVQLGNQLRAARLNKGYSLAEVANMVGKSKVSIKRYEDASVRIDMDTLESLANIYGMDIMDVTSTNPDNTINSMPFLVRKLDDDYIANDKELQRYYAYLTALSNKMFDNFMELDVDSQRIVLMMLKMDDIEKILTNIR